MVVYWFVAAVGMAMGHWISKPSSGVLKGYIWGGGDPEVNAIDETPDQDFRLSKYE